jgi:cytochrome c-type biogenesis protein CcmH/NrfF
MKQIDEFVNSIYADVSGKEAKEMKEEMRSHLVESVEELKAEGKSEQEAISFAISRFGDEKQITKGLFGIFKAQNKVVKNLFRVALICLVIGLGILIGLIVRDKTIDIEVTTINSTARTIIDNLGDTEPSKAEREQIISTLQEVTNGKLENYILFKKPEGSPEQIEEKDYPEVYSKMEQMVKFGETHKWKMRLENRNWHSEIGFKENTSYGTLYAIPIGLLIVFAILALTAFVLKIKSYRKILNAFLSE